MMRWMEGPGESARATRRAARIALVALLAIAMTASAASAAREATNEEIALLVLANQMRADPSVDGGTEPVVPPMLWSDELAAAAQAHSDDMAANGCFQHNSCNGTSWSKRITKYYPNWAWIGENIGSGSFDPRFLTLGWLHSPGHRANIVSGSYNEFGAATAAGRDGFGALPLATEDFGRRALIALNALPTLPAGCVLPRHGAASEQRELLVNYYHYNGGPPRAVRAIAGSSCIAMSLNAGTATHGTYRAARAISGNGCVPLVFEAIRSDGTIARWPTSGALLVGVGGATCAERTANAPTTNCGGIPAPTPTPAATPRPSDPPPAAARQVSIASARVTIKPGPANTSKGRVNVQATLGAPADFDPTAGDLRIALEFGSDGEWRKTLPQLCGGSACLKANKRGTAYTGKYGTLSVRLSRDSRGRWTLHLTATGQTLSGIAPGTVRLDVSVSGLTDSTDLVGTVRDRSLYAK
jgi:uncharacterized protein YkwD